jgi:hypothetical protein
MAVVKGTNCGFVTSAPSAAPGGATAALDNTSRAQIDVAPAGATKITEIGWWASTATEESNFEVGLYSHDAVNDCAKDRLYVNNTNAKGTTGGWKTVAVDWAITAGTTYWIAVQVDDTATATGYDYSTGTGTQSGVCTGGSASLIDPWVNAGTGNRLTAFYAVWEAAAGGTNMQINIGDAWKAVPAMQINIGDAWKAVAGAQINIGDVWKTIF